MEFFPLCHLGRRELNKTEIMCRGTFGFWMYTFKLTNALRTDVKKNKNNKFCDGPVIISGAGTEDRQMALELLFRGLDLREYDVSL